MPKVTPELFRILNAPKTEAVLAKLYKAALNQGWTMVFHFLPKAHKLLGKGIDWKSENETFYDDKYIPILPAQGTFIYMQVIALKAKNILEFGTSYGISTLYLAQAAKVNGGKVITTELLPHKVKAARQHFEEAELADYIEIRQGNALDTLKTLNHDLDFVLLDGWPDLVFPVFRLIEPKLKKGSVIIVDDVVGFKPSMQNYLDYVRNPDNGFLSDTIHAKKGLEFTIKI